MHRLTTYLVIALVVACFIGGYSARQTYESRYKAPATGQLPAGLTAYAESARSDVGRRVDIDLRPRDTFIDVLRLVQQHYVERIQDSQRKDLAYGALQNMLDSLKDPNTRFLEPEQARIVEEASAGKFHGIGAVFGVIKAKNEDGIFEQLVVASVLPGSNAEKAGIKPGDIVQEIDGKSILPYNPFQKMERLIKAQRYGEISREDLIQFMESEDKRIKEGINFQSAGDKLSAAFKDKVELTLDRNGTKVKAKVASADITIDPVTFSIKNDIGFLDINLFTDETEARVAAALGEARKKNVAGLVVDLRGNPGGSVGVANRVAGLFDPGKTFAVVAKSAGRRVTLEIPTANSEDKSKVWSRPLVVLVDKGTVSAAELLAGALRDNHKAKLVGTRTFGQGLQVTMLPQRDGSAVEFTTGKFLTPNGIDFHLKGLKVDDEVLGEQEQMLKAEQLARTG